MKNISFGFFNIFLFFCISVSCSLLQDTPNIPERQITQNLKNKIELRSNRINPRKLALALKNQKASDLRIQLTDEKIALIMKKLKTKDNEFYNELVKLNNRDKREYLVLNRERLLMANVSGILMGLAGAGIAGAAVLIKSVVDTRKTNVLALKLTKTKQELSLSKMQRRKDIQEFQQSFSQMENALISLKESLYEKSYELHNSIGMSLGS